MPRTEETSDEPKEAKADAKDAKKAGDEASDVAPAPSGDKRPIDGGLASEGVVSNTNSLQPEESIEMPAPHSASDVMSSRGMNVHSTPNERGATNFANVESAKPAQGVSIANTVDVICEGGMNVACEQRPEPEVLSEKVLSDGQRTAQAKAGSRTLPLNDNPVGQEPFRQASNAPMSEGQANNRAAPAHAPHVNAFSNVVSVPPVTKGSSPASSQFAGAQVMLCENDPYAIACAQANRGGPPYFSNFSSPVYVASSDLTLRENFIHAPHGRDGHQERQDRHGKGNDQGSNSEHPFDDSDEEDGNVLAIS